MTRTKIILKGYYGYGNLGDDVLALVTFRWVRAHFPEAEIVVSTDSPFPHYLSALFGENTEQVRRDAPVEAEWAVQGGGGVYFDFAEGPGKFKLLNRIIHVLGYRFYRKLFAIQRTMRHRTINKARFNIGVGIGVGTYTDSSARFHYDILQLSAFDLLLVRDEESRYNIMQYGFGYPVETFTDLAFLHNYWNSIGNGKRRAKKIGIVLRDWTYDNHSHQEMISNSAAELAADGFELAFYSFDRNADKVFIERFSSRYTVHVWDPATETLEGFLEDFGTCEVVITSRAHGAIVAACLGIPTICLCIEPKLAKISAMLHRSSLPLHTPFTTMQLVDAVKDRLSNQFAADDVAENRSTMEGGMERAFQFMKSIKRNS